MSIGCVFFQFLFTFFSYQGGPLLLCQISHRFSHCNFFLLISLPSHALAMSIWIDALFVDFFYIFSTSLWKAPGINSPSSLFPERPLYLTSIRLKTRSWVCTNWLLFRCLLINTFLFKKAGNNLQPHQKPPIFQENSGDFFNNLTVFALAKNSDEFQFQQLRLKSWAQILSRLLQKFVFWDSF